MRRITGMEADPRLVELIVRARKVLVFTGAGISTGSGIADYRGPTDRCHVHTSTLVWVGMDE